MKITPPKAASWWVAFVCALVWILCTFKIILVPPLAPYLDWVLLGGLVLLLLATILPGL